MVRAVLVISLGLYVALATGEAPVVGPACAQQCADDDDDGHCAPTCSDCACCSHVRAITVPQAARPLVLALRARPLERVLLTPPSPEPREILHVPIA